MSSTSVSECGLRRAGVWWDAAMCLWSGSMAIRRKDCNLFRRGGLEFILTRCVSFAAELLKTTLVRRGERTGNYHNPKRQRGIFGNSGETPNHNPSLTFRVVNRIHRQHQSTSARSMRIRTISSRTFMNASTTSGSKCVPLSSFRISKHLSIGNAGL